MCQMGKMGRMPNGSWVMGQSVMCQMGKMGRVPHGSWVKWAMGHWVMCQMIHGSMGHDSNGSWFKWIIGQMGQMGHGSNGSWVKWVSRSCVKWVTKFGSIIYVKRYGLWLFDLRARTVHNKSNKFVFQWKAKHPIKCIQLRR